MPCFSPKSSPMVATAAMQCKHLPDDSIQWLVVKHGMCSRGGVQPPLHHCIPVVIEITSEVEGCIFCIVDFIVVHNLMLMQRPCYGSSNLKL